MHTLLRRSAILAFLACLTCALPAFAQPPAGQIVSPVVGADRKVTFRLRAPNAKDVKVDGDWTTKPVAMAKDDKGVWSLTTEPLEPNLYGYFFVVDGTNIADPSNTFMRVGTKNIKSQLNVPGDKADFLAIKNVPHGALHEHWYDARRSRRRGGWWSTLRRATMPPPPKLTLCCICYMAPATMRPTGRKLAGRTSSWTTCWPPGKPSRR